MIILFRLTIFSKLEYARIIKIRLNVLLRKRIEESFRKKFKQFSRLERAYKSIFVFPFFFFCLLTHFPAIFDRIAPFPGN